MKRWTRLPLFVASCAACSKALATLAISGVVLIEPDPSILLRGQTATLTYTITNTGDESIDVATAGTDYYDWGPTSTLFPLGTAATPPCTMTYVDFIAPPGQPPAVVNTVFFQPRPVLPGETRQCVMEITVSEETDGPFVQQFGFTGARGVRNVSVSQNVFFSLGQTTAVPALSPFSLGALILGLLGIGAMLARR